MDAYRDLAPIYAHVWGRSHTFDIAAGRLVGAGAKSFIEFGCGPGTLLHWLRARFPEMRLEGVDLSPAMIREARRGMPGAEMVMSMGRVMSMGGPRFLPPSALSPFPAAEEKKPEPNVPALPIHWTVGDIRKGVSRKYDAAGAFGQVLDHLLRVEDLESAIDGVKRSLNEGGLFVFDLSTPSKHIARVWGASGHNWAIAGTTHVERRYYAHDWRIAQPGRIIVGNSHNRIWGRGFVKRVLRRRGCAGGYRWSNRDRAPVQHERNPPMTDFTKPLARTFDDDKAITVEIISEKPTSGGLVKCLREDGREIARHRDRLTAMNDAAKKILGG